MGNSSFGSLPQRTGSATSDPLGPPQPSSGHPRDFLSSPRPPHHDSLANGIPMLPHDLNLDGPPSEAHAPPPPAASINFGGFNAPLGGGFPSAGGFAPGGPLFPHHSSTALWPPGQASNAPQQASGAPGSLDTIYSSGSPFGPSRFSSGPPPTPPANVLGSPTLPGVQLGFGQFGQFDPLQAPGQTPFVPTGALPLLPPVL